MKAFLLLTFSSRTRSYVIYISFLFLFLVPLLFRLGLTPPLSLSVMTLIQKNHSETNQVMGSVSMNNPLFRSESFGHNYNYCYYYPEQNYTMMEKRQLFLRSYQFSRKKSLTERIKGSLVRVKKVVWLRLRSARRLRWLVFSRLKCAFYYRRRRFSRLLSSHSRKSESSSCFW